MSAISLKSITGITSITTPAGVDDQLTLHNNNTTEAVKLDVAGNVHVNNHLAIAGVSTFSDDIKIPVTNKKLIIGASGQLQLYNQGYHSRIDHVGNHWLAIRSNAIALQDASDNYYFDGRQSTGSARLFFNNNPKLETTNTGINVTGGGVFTSTDAGSAAEPEVVLYRNSASPADADYLGQIKFNGKSDTGAQRTYAKMTGKILDASNGTEDGIIEFAHIKGGSQNISARFRSDSLQLLNSTSLTVAGTTTLSDSLSVNADNKYIKIGAGDDLAFVHTGGQSYITNATGHLTQRSASYTWENSAGSTEYARIDSNGDVGISSIAPRARLDVKDANTSHPVILRVSADNAPPYALVVGNDTHNTDANNGLAMWVGGSKTHHIQARTSETASENKLEIEAYETTIQTGSSMNQNFVFDSSGRLLMNGAASGNAFSGGDDLIIGNSSSARSGITLVSESSNDGGLYFSKGTSSNSDHVMGQIVYQHDNNGGYLRLYTNTSEKVRITSDGNLLLGTTSDTQRLHVYNGNGAAGYKTALFNSNDTANGTRIVFANSGNTSGRGLGINVGGQTYGPGQNKASFGWYNTDNTFATYHSIITITSDAKIGINQIAPQTGLHINQDWVANYGSISAEGSNNALVGLGLRSSGTYRAALIWRDGSSGDYLELATQSTSNPILFKPNNTERVRVQDGGLKLNGGSYIMEISAGHGAPNNNNRVMDQRRWMWYGTSSSTHTVARVAKASSGQPGDGDSKLAAWIVTYTARSMYGFNSDGGYSVMKMRTGRFDYDDNTVRFSTEQDTLGTGGGSQNPTIVFTDEGSGVVRISITNPSSTHSFGEINLMTYDCRITLPSG